MRLNTQRLLEILERIYNRLFETYLDTQNAEIAERLLAVSQSLELLIQSVGFVQRQSQPEEHPLTQSHEESFSYSSLDDA
jgi:hypothetical protein